MSDDPIFDRFAAKLADAVTVAINSGIRVSARYKDCYCPLGCLAPDLDPEASNEFKRPCGAQARSYHESVRHIPDMAPHDFAYMFDTGKRIFGNNEKYQELALLYRERFP